MKQLYYSAVGYTALGLVSGLFYRNFTEAHHFNGRTELAVTHTHLLALGTLFFLIVIGLEKQFALSRSRAFLWFLWVYNAGVLWTVLCMALIGIRTVLGDDESDPLAEMAGAGHIMLTVGFGLFFVCLYGPVKAADRRSPGHDRCP
ncbi:DUF2871 domain-containing protein [Nocardia sp. NPDC020380]|uniref:DUF2871 domain-containing protein n=1 Tax=Nocardia sp. NPDC020380 TaxID=3364309 RepID=UPI0037ACAC9E